MTGDPQRPPFATFRSHNPLASLLALTLANLRLLSRNRQVMVFNVLVPLLLIVIFGGLFQKSTTEVDISAPAQYSGLLSAAMPSSAFHLQHVSQATARRQVLNNSVSFAIVIPAASSTPVRARIEENAGNVTENGAPTAVGEGVVLALNQSLLHSAPAATLQVDALRPPGGLSSGSVANNNYIDFLTPGILAYAVLTAGLSAGMRLVGDREKGTLRRVRATPMPVWAFLGSSVLSQLVLVATQVVVLLGVGHLMYGVGIGPSPGPVILVLLVGSLCFLAAGFLVAGLARREQAAVVMVNLITLPQLFVAGIFYPLAGAPQWLQKLSVVMPLTYFSNSLRGLMAQGQRLPAVAGDILVLLVIGVVVLSIAARIFRFQPAATGG